MNKTYRISRLRGTDFIVNCPLSKKTYKFNGAKGSSIDTKEIEEETYLWLLNSTTTFRDAELVVAEEHMEEFKDQVLEEELETIKANSHSREEIVKLLEGNTNTMKKKLEEITQLEEKQFVAQVASEIKLDSVAKVEFIKSWSGIDVTDKE
jgi:hypothetical protein